MNRAQLYGPLVVIESPRRGYAPMWLPFLLQRLMAALDAAQNRRYAKLCLRDSLLRGEHPYGVPLASGGTEREASARERTGQAWGAHGEVRAYYLDRGLCHGMQASMLDVVARPLQHVECRTLWPRRSWVATDAELRALSSREAP